MLYRLVRPMKRSGSSIRYFVQRIPADVRPLAIGRTFDIPLGGGTAKVRISERMQAIRVSLRTRDPAEAKIRQGVAAADLERVWQALRRDRPVVVTRHQAHALAGELYRAWADGQREGDLAAIHDPKTGRWTIERPNHLEDEEEAQGFEAAARRLSEAAEGDGLEAALGAVVDRLLLRKGIAAVDPECRPLLLDAFAMALQDAFQHRKRNAEGDYTPDPKAGRFPEWTAPGARGAAAKDRDGARSGGVSGKSTGTVTTTGLVDGWWSDAKARGLKPSTHESYEKTAAGLVTFLRHDDASRVTPKDIVAFKDHRIASVNLRTGKPISAKTVRDNDLAGLKAIFGWAVDNRRLPSNPVIGITIKPSRRPPRLRSKGFTDAEASAILCASSQYRPGKLERPQTAAAKRWVPWLCAYTGARVGEMVQLRKEDVRQEEGQWVLRITPETGTVKTNEARDVVLHPHLVEQGFPEFVAKAPGRYLFLIPPKDGGDVLGPLQGVKNRLQEFARAIVTDRNVAPNHGWRHRFKTVGMEAEIPSRILDAIQGQVSGAVADTYGEVALRTQAREIAKLPRYPVPVRP